MAKKKSRNRAIATNATRVLDAAGVAYERCPYAYVERGGTRASSAALGVDEHAVIKTLVFEDDRKRPFIICQHGDREVSAKALARALGVKSVRPCAPDVAQRHSGYRVGGTSPFGLRKSLPIYVESSILILSRIWINGGVRGLLVSLDPQCLVDVVHATEVSVARDGGGNGGRTPARAAPEPPG
ncbi:MAG: aminoacyl-tRNA deacylase, partial [Myxococcota bacterium]|nr:aminoacyl-tRNA deacylase [Myxococcota bacterium]